MGRTPHQGLLGLANEGDTQIAQKALAFTGISHLATRKIDALSGGEKNRLLLARLIYARHNVLVLDEPTNHLDNDVSRRLIANLKSIPGRPAVLMITHDRDVIAACSRIYLLREGRVIAQGDPVEVMREGSRDLTISAIRQVAYCPHPSLKGTQMTMLGAL